MIIAGNIFIALATFEFLAVILLLKAVNTDKATLLYILLIGIALFFTFSAVYCVLVAAGRLDALGLPRWLLYLGAVVSSGSLVFFMGSALGSTQYQPGDIAVALRFFGANASWVVPSLMILLAFFVLNHSAVPQIPLSLLRGLLFALGVVGIVVSFSTAIEGMIGSERDKKEREEGYRKAEIERKNETLAKVQQADPATDFGVLLMTTKKGQPDDSRQLATQKLLSNGPKFAELMTVQLRTGDHENGLQFLLDNDPPGAAALAEPVRDAMLRVCAHVKDQETFVWATDFERLTDVLLKIADKYSAYGVDYVPAIKEYRSALDTPGRTQLYQPPETRKKVDAWLASKAKS